ncbi:4'-phosphopantetheinyl transferase family protein [Solicola gregarius]|uniref:4'-phosphopantetheinyl transferase superfamily protein n=1 Tax=Solicola gregarius TaxID=2908642 RepID=A0AA46TE95_9ACTN|nr:4'-phosphopantetheinyl transferase superfamily protein [Solicola gregarius]UYM03625.1 4'-phosphopantetheinyl transferase superfamily protein [Solicola gregarius]
MCSAIADPARTENDGTSLLDRIVTEPVRVVETRADREIALFGSEHRAIAGAVPRRRAEFGTVRWCARAALDELGIAAVPILPGERGAPIWPDGVVGAMTHCTGYRAAALARASDVAALGVDAEPNEPLPAGVLGIVASAEEAEALATLPRRGIAWDRVLFSAKESVYKAWFPLARRWLGFEDAVVAVHPDGCFTAAVDPRLAVGVSPDRYDGRWFAGSELVVTAVTVPT